jgi:hypothetical protein
LEGSLPKFVEWPSVGYRHRYGAAADFAHRRRRWTSRELPGAAKDAAKPLNLGFLPLNQRYPRLAAWVKRVDALSGYERTYPPHWK